MTIENKRSAKITLKTRIEKTLVDSKALKEAQLLPNFLRINFYFDKEVLEYLGQSEQGKSNIKIEKSSKKSSKLAVSEEQILELCQTEKSLREIT